MFGKKNERKILCVRREINYLSLECYFRGLHSRRLKKGLKE